VTKGNGLFVRSGHDGLGLLLGIFNASLIENIGLRSPLLIGPSDNLLGFLASSLYLGLSLPVGRFNPLAQIQLLLFDDLQRRNGSCIHVPSLLTNCSGYQHSQEILHNLFSIITLFDPSINPSGASRVCPGF
jgi:hypothetical protein